MGGNEFKNTSDLTDTGWILNGAPFNVGFRTGRDFKENSDKPVVLKKNICHDLGEEFIEALK